MSDAEQDVLIIFRDKAGQRLVARHPWVKDKRLRYYLKSPFFRSHGLLALSLKSRLMNQTGRKLRLNDPLNSGDSVRIIPAGRTEV